MQIYDEVVVPEQIGVIRGMNLQRTMLLILLQSGEYVWVPSGNVVSRRPVEGSANLGSERE